MLLYKVCGTWQQTEAISLDILSQFPLTETSETERWAFLLLTAIASDTLRYWLCGVVWRLILNIGAYRLCAWNVQLRTWIRHEKLKFHRPVSRKLNCCTPVWQALRCCTSIGRKLNCCTPFWWKLNHWKAVWPKLKCCTSIWQKLKCCTTVWRKFKCCLTKLENFYPCLTIIEMF
jgi:hypothetical protein